MPRRKLTNEYIYEIIDESKERFYLSPFFNKEIKDILKGINPCVCNNDEMSNKYYATASIEHSLSDTVEKYDLKENFDPVIIDGRMSWFVIEINFKYLRKSNKGTVYDTVSHELAHLLEMKINGYYNRKDRRYHNAYWKKIHRTMGGSGMSSEKGYLEWLQKNKLGK